MTNYRVILRLVVAVARLTRCRWTSVPSSSSRRSPSTRRSSSWSRCGSRRAPYTTCSSHAAGGGAARRAACSRRRCIRAHPASRSARCTTCPSTGHQPAGPRRTEQRRVTALWWQYRPSTSGPSENWTETRHSVMMTVQAVNQRALRELNRDVSQRYDDSTGRRPAGPRRTEQRRVTALWWQYRPSTSGPSENWTETCHSVMMTVQAVDQRALRELNRDVSQRYDDSTGRRPAGPRRTEQRRVMALWWQYRPSTSGPSENWTETCHSVMMTVQAVDQRALGELNRDASWRYDDSTGRRPAGPQRTEQRRVTALWWQYRPSTSGPSENWTETRHSVMTVQAVDQRALRELNRDASQRYDDSTGHRPAGPRRTEQRRVTALWWQYRPSTSGPSENWTETCHSVMMTVQAVDQRALRELNRDASRRYDDNTGRRPAGPRRTEQRRVTALWWQYRPSTSGPSENWTETCHSVMMTVQAVDQRALRELNRDVSQRYDDSTGRRPAGPQRTEQRRVTALWWQYRPSTSGPSENWTETRHSVMMTIQAVDQRALRELNRDVSQRYDDSTGRRPAGPQRNEQRRVTVLWWQYRPSTSGPSENWTETRHSVMMTVQAIDQRALRELNRDASQRYDDNTGRRPAGPRRTEQRRVTALWWQYRPSTSGPSENWTTETRHSVMMTVQAVDQQALRELNRDASQRYDSTGRRPAGPQRTEQRRVTALWWQYRPSTSGPSENWTETRHSVMTVQAVDQRALRELNRDASQRYDDSTGHRPAGPRRTEQRRVTALWWQYRPSTSGPSENWTETRHSVMTVQAVDQRALRELNRDASQRYDDSTGHRPAGPRRTEQRRVTALWWQYRPSTSGPSENWTETRHSVMMTVQAIDQRALGELNRDASQCYDDSTGRRPAGPQRTEQRRVTVLWWQYRPSTSGPSENWTETRHSVMMTIQAVDQRALRELNRDASRRYDDSTGRRPASPQSTEQRRVMALWWQYRPSTSGPSENWTETRHSVMMTIQAIDQRALRELNNRDTSQRYDDSTGRQPAGPQRTEQTRHSVMMTVQAVDQRALRELNRDASQRYDDSTGRRPAGPQRTEQRRVTALWWQYRPSTSGPSENWTTETRHSVMTVQAVNQRARRELNRDASWRYDDSTGRRPAGPRRTEQRRVMALWWQYRPSTSGPSENWTETRHSVMMTIQAVDKRAVRELNRDASQRYDDNTGRRQAGRQRTEQRRVTALWWQYRPSTSGPSENWTETRHGVMMTVQAVDQRALRELNRDASRRYDDSTGRRPAGPRRTENFLDTLFLLFFSLFSTG